MTTPEEMSVECSECRDQEIPDFICRARKCDCEFCEHFWGSYFAKLDETERAMEEARWEQFQNY